MSDKKEIEEMLNLFEKVKRNAKIVTAQELGQDYVLHISMNTNIRKFVPFISHRQIKGEDRTMARVCVCPTLLGAIMGHSGVDLAFFRNIPDGKGMDDAGTQNNGGYRGGFKIYALPFKVGIKPNESIVPESKLSDEHWLVTYNDETKEYIPQAAGKIFYTQLVFRSSNDNYPKGDGTLYVEVTRDGGIAFSKSIHLTKGYWKIEGPTYDTVVSWKDDKMYSVKEISKTEYMSAKSAHADLLSYEETPAWAKW